MREVHLVVVEQVKVRLVSCMKILLLVQLSFPHEHLLLLQPVQPPLLQAKEVKRLFLPTQISRSLVTNMCPS